MDHGGAHHAPGQEGDHLHILRMFSGSVPLVHKHRQLGRRVGTKTGRETHRRAGTKVI